MPAQAGIYYRCHSEFISESIMKGNTNSYEILKQVQYDSAGGMLKQVQHDSTGGMWTPAFAGVTGKKARITDNFQRRFSE